jgi:hypothetical protein
MADVRSFGASATLMGTRVARARARPAAIADGVGLNERFERLVCTHS